MSPQFVDGRGGPRPKKLSAASKSTALAISIVVCTTMMSMRFGNP